jgi:hypothetical protein
VVVTVRGVAVDVAVPGADRNEVGAPDVDVPVVLAPVARALCGGVEELFSIDSGWSGDDAPPSRRPIGVLDAGAVFVAEEDELNDGDTLDAVPVSALQPLISPTTNSIAPPITPARTPVLTTTDGDEWCRVRFALWVT